MTLRPTGMKVCGKPNKEWVHTPRSPPETYKKGCGTAPQVEGGALSPVPDGRGVAGVGLQKQTQDSRRGSAGAIFRPASVSFFIVVHKPTGQVFCTDCQQAQPLEAAAQCPVHGR